MQAFAFGVAEDGQLSGVMAGYIQADGRKIKSFLSRRAIVNGGLLLADDISDESVRLLLQAAKRELKKKAIYIETRNFNDYSRWKGVFAKNDFEYVPHLNFQVHTNQQWDVIEANIGKHRKKYIRLSFRDGAQVVENPTIGQIKEYYKLLGELYESKIRRPLFPFSFFEKLYGLESCKYILIGYDDKIVGGSVCMVLPEKGVYEWFACGSDGRYKNIYPSSVTKYAGMKYAWDNGFKVFDMMGAGKPDEPYGVRDFKAEFGGELVEHGRFLHICNPLLYKIGVLGVKIMKLL